MGKGTIVVWNGIYEVRSDHPWRFLWEWLVSRCG